MFKKYIFLLILSLFSVQSFAGSCADGSEPVKSVSADGSYFVYNCGGLVTGSASGASEDDSVSIVVSGRFTEDQSDVNDDYQVHYIYFLASDTPDKRLDVNGWIEKLALKANADLLYWSALSPNSKGVGQQFKLDYRLDSKLDITFLRATVPEKTINSVQVPASYIFNYIRKAGFDNSRKVYAILVGFNTYEGNSKGGEGGTALMTVFIPAAKSYSQDDREALILHELIHTQGVGFTCGKRDIGQSGHIQGNDIMGENRNGMSRIIDKFNDTYYRHNIQECPDMSKSVYLTPTAEDSWDPYEVFCRRNTGGFTFNPEKFYGCKDRPAIN